MVSTTIDSSRQLSIPNQRVGGSIPSRRTVCAGHRPAGWRSSFPEGRRTHFLTLNIHGPLVLDQLRLRDAPDRSECQEQPRCLSTRCNRAHVDTTPQQQSQAARRRRAQCLVRRSHSPHETARACGQLVAEAPRTHRAQCQDSSRNTSGGMVTWWVGKPYFASTLLGRSMRSHLECSCGRVEMTNPP